jgi:hypothetical protein
LPQRFADLFRSKRRSRAAADIRAELRAAGVVIAIDRDGQSLEAAERER